MQCRCCSIPFRLALRCTQTPPAPMTTVMVRACVRARCVCVGGLSESCADGGDFIISTGDMTAEQAAEADRLGALLADGGVVRARCAGAKVVWMGLLAEAEGVGCLCARVCVCACACSTLRAVLAFAVRGRWRGGRRGRW